MDNLTRNNKLKNLIGNLPNESGFIKKMRFHQAWWRAFVLGEEQGLNPVNKDDVVGNTIINGEESGKNFLTEKALEAVLLTLEERKEFAAGKMEEDRLFNNLLSSQPLCFNFFGELKSDLRFAKEVIVCFYPSVSKVNQVWFEFAPRVNYSNDNSAFDIALEVEIEGKKGLIGLECKFTEKFSQDVYDKSEYKEIYNKCKVFKRDYKVYVDKRYNQLFRNQLMAEAMIQNGDYDFVYTGLFCHHEDQNANKIGAEFVDLLDLNVDFKVITFREFVEQVQRLKITWEQREWSNLLWARYCSLELSEVVNKEGE